MKKEPKTVALLGVPLDLGAQNLGVDIGPSALRDENIVKKLELAGLAVVDKGDIKCGKRNELSPGNPKLRYLDEIVRVAEETAKVCQQSLLANQKMLVIGGDHSMCLGAVSGASAAYKGKLGLIYLDAHGDMNTDKTTPTGNIHGMHLASLIGVGSPQLSLVYDGKSPKINPTDLLHIGGNDFDPAELELIKNQKIRSFSLFDLLSSNLSPLLRMIDKLAQKQSNIWISLDLDVIDCLYAPGVGMPNKKGLTYREITAITEYIGNHANVVGVDVAEYNPLADSNQKTAELSIELIANLFGKSYGWYQTYLEKNKLP